MLRTVVDFVFPSLCVVCARGATAFCRDCRDGVAPLDAWNAGGLEVHVAGAYDGALRSAILAFKHGRRDVGVALADFLAHGWTAPEGVVLVPVPTARARAGARGFDQAILLARELGRHTGLPVLAALRRCGADSQNGRPRAERLLAKGRFALAPVAARGVLAGARAVVVDDVVTTGATLADAIATLACGGVAVDCGVAIARAFPRAPRAGGPASAASATVSYRGDGRAAASGGLGPPLQQRIRMPKAIWNDVVIAESDATEVVEGNQYFPADSIKREYFSASATHSTCPWKGEASYYTVTVDGKKNADAAWFYPTPKDAAKQIKDHVAFWKGVKVEA